MIKDVNRHKPEPPRLALRSSAIRRQRRSRTGNAVDATNRLSCILSGAAADKELRHFEVLIVALSVAFRLYLLHVPGPALMTRASDST